MNISPCLSDVFHLTSTLRNFANMAVPASMSCNRRCSVTPRVTKKIPRYVAWSWEVSFTPLIETGAGRLITLHFRTVHSICTPLDHSTQESRSRCITFIDNASANTSYTKRVTNSCDRSIFSHQSIFSCLIRLSMEILNSTGRGGSPYGIPALVQRQE